MLVQPKGIHYLPIVHDKSSRTHPNHWYFLLYKNGQLITGIPIVVTFLLASIAYGTGRRVHVISFQNDGTPDSTWELIAIDRSSPYNFYQRAWNVVANVDTNKQVKYLRSRLDSDGGYTGKDRA